MNKLYEIANEYKFLIDSVEDTGELSEDIITRLQKLQTDFNEKCINITKVIKSLDAESEAIEKEQKNMADRRNRLESKIRSLKDYLVNQMTTLDIKEVKCPQFVIKIRSNPSSVDQDHMDESLVPYEYKKMSFTWDIQRINQDLRNGKEIPGVRLINKKSVQFS